MDMLVSTVKFSSGKLSSCIASVIVVMLLASAAVYGTYHLQQQTIDDLNRRVNDLESSSKPLAELRKKVEEAQQSLVESITCTSDKGTDIRVYVPESDSAVQSPLIVLGEVPGDWSFEASFPVKLLDDAGNEIAAAPAQLQSDWMTNELVPFIAKLELSTNYTGNAELLLEKDNPSGLAENDDVVRIPIQLRPSM